MEEFLEFVVKHLVNHPDQVSITPVPKDGLVVYELRLHAEDMGKIIGREGNTINAIRSLLQVGCAKKNIRGSLTIVEE